MSAVHLRTAGVRYQLLCGLTPVVVQGNLFGKAEKNVRPCTATILRATCEPCIARFNTRLKPRVRRALGGAA